MRNEQKHAARAKIFLPFDTRKGFRDYLKCKERVVVDRKRLSSDACEILNRKLQQVKLGQIVEIIYYDQQEYVKVEGMVSKFDPEYLRLIQIVDKVINIHDIIEINSEEWRSCNDLAGENGKLFL